MIDVQYLAKTNDTLPDDYVVQVKAQRQSVKEQLEALNVELHRHKNGVLELESRSSGLSAVRARRKQLTAQLSACNTVLAPHKRLPAELLSQIFLAAYLGPTSIPVELRSSPLVLCHVCSRWRLIALETPELWANIIFRFSRSLDPYKTLVIAEHWLARSGTTAVLSLVVVNQWSGMDRHPDHEEVTQAVVGRLIIPFASRFRKLHLSLPESVLRPFLSSGTGRFPSLTQLSVILDGSSLGNNSSLPVTTFNANSSPNLVDVEVINFAQGLPFKKTNLPWASITRLHLVKTSAYMSQCHALLRKCNKLVDCEMSAIIIQEGDPRYVRITMPFLEVFSLSISLGHGHPGSAEVGSFFEPLVAPRLTNLDINCASPASYGWGHDSFMKFISQSSCAIEVLRVAKLSFESEHAAQIVEALPSLVEFCIGIDNILPQPILGRISNGELLPNLKILVCCILELESIIELLESRWRTSKKTDGELGLSCPNWIMVDYTGENITPLQASRIDRLRSMGITIDATRVGRRY